MPVVLPRDRWDAWLDPTAQDVDHVRGLLAPVAPGRFEAYPVSRAVGNVASEGPQLLAPVPASELVGVVDPMTGEVIGGPAA